MPSRHLDDLFYKNVILGNAVTKAKHTYVLIATKGVRSVYILHHGSWVWLSHSVTVVFLSG